MLVVKNWETFQHYKDRCPPWIKLHKTLLDNIDYHNLECHAAKALPLLWLIASEHNGRLPSVGELAFRLRITLSEMESIVLELEKCSFLFEQKGDAPAKQDTTPSQERALANGFGSRHIADAVKQSVWKRDAGKCCQCGSTANVEYDHTVPVSKGGNSNESNVQLLCRPCNRRKRTGMAKAAEQVATPAQQEATHAQPGALSRRSLEKRRGEESREDSFGRSPTATRPEDEDSFEEFWKVYPRRSGTNPKHPARLKFLAALKAGVHAQEIIAGARTYAGRERSKVGTEFIAQAKTWLNQRCWQDYAPGAATNGHAAPDSVSDFQARWKANAEKQLKEREELEAMRARKSN